MYWLDSVLLSWQPTTMLLFNCTSNDKNYSYIYMLFDPFKKPSCRLEKQMRVIKVANQKLAAELLYPLTTLEEFIHV